MIFPRLRCLKALNLFSKLLEAIVATILEHFSLYDIGGSESTIKAFSWDALLSVVVGVTVFSLRVRLAFSAIFMVLKIQQSQLRPRKDIGTRPTRVMLRDWNCTHPNKLCIGVPGFNIR